MAQRRLVVCFDGTWNKPQGGAEPTNVVKLLRAIRNQDGAVSQITFYDKGVGTGSGLSKYVEGITGQGLTDNVIDGYRFLGNNYDPGDEIYIFGFSRGAYTARSLAGLVGLVGIIGPNDLGGGLATALGIYRDKNLDRAQKQQAVDDLGLERQTHVRVTCVGVWDTVGSLGIPGDLGRQYFAKSLYFHDVQLSDMVGVALHAVAIDEKRSAFSPTLWVRETDTTPPADQIVEQVWFSGVHSNIGGSYQDTGLSDIALDWMLKRVAHHTNLAFDPQYLQEQVRPNVEGRGVESRTGLYLDSRLYPYQRLIGQVVPQGTGLGEWFRTHFPRWDRRNIPPSGLTSVHEMIHISALER